METIIIAFGNGRNGKSTFFNLLAQVLGSYSCNMFAEILTKDYRRNKGNELAELRGKRLVIASELEENKQLDTAALKHICSTDKIHAEKKYKDPFDFTPSHTVILHTNHLPSVSTSDAGTWRRVVVIPFNAVIKEDTDIKNYTEFLFNNSGGAVLKWIVDGAHKFISANYKIETPQCVKDILDNYRHENDWLGDLISECCMTGKSYKQKSGELYERYREYCSCQGEFAKSNSIFKRALENAGFSSKKTNKGAIVQGLQLVFSSANPQEGLHTYAPIKSYNNKVTEGDEDFQNFLDSDNINF